MTGRGQMAQAHGGSAPPKPWSWRGALGGAGTGAWPWRVGRGVGAWSGASPGSDGSWRRQDLAYSTGTGSAGGSWHAVAGLWTWWGVRLGPGAGPRARFLSGSRQFLASPAFRKPSRCAEPRGQTGAGAPWSCEPRPWGCVLHRVRDNREKYLVSLGTVVCWSGSPRGQGQGGFTGAMGLQGEVQEPGSCGGTWVGVPWGVL